MNGRPGKRLIPIAMLIALVVQFFPASLPGVSGLGYAQDGVQLRGLDLDIGDSLGAGRPDLSSENGFIMQQLDEENSVKTLDAGSQQALQGQVTSIRVTRGRSQIVKFAQPIMKMSIAEPTV